MKLKATFTDVDSRRLIAALTKYEGDSVNKARQAIFKGGLAIQRDAKQLAPVDTGLLRGSIRCEFEFTGLAALIGTDVEYAPYVEFGTSRQRAQPYLMPAYDANRNDIVENLKQAFE